MFSENPGLKPFARLALAMADAAAEVTLKHFRASSLLVDNKEIGEDFDPVTVADRGAESAMRHVLAAERPDDGIYGEEHGQRAGTSGLTWVIDPIDGTRAYVSGLPVWGTLIGLDDGVTGRVGVIDQPYLGERYIGLWGEANAAHMLRDGAATPIRTRKGRLLGDAVMFTTDPFLFDGAEAGAFSALRDRARLTRYGCDCYAYALVASGQIDLVVESGLNAYDIASHIPLIRAAGGVVTDWTGGDCRWGGQVVAAGSAALHEEVLELISSTSGRG
ncbi:MAG: histidinol-phosphatase [Pseudomonadota bacterium]